jgi:transmembrane sensor
MESEKAGVQAERIASRFIAQRAAGPWSDEDGAELERWLTASTLNLVAYYRLNAAWEELGRLEVLGAAPKVTELGSVAHLSRMQDLRWSQALAACLALAAVAVLFVFRESIFHLNRYSTAVGGLEAVQMKDGSRVVLNTNSVLRIHLTSKERRIDLDRGEAFFDVAKDPARPFIVQAGDKRVVAVGTRFSVRRESNEVRVSVADGAVRVEPLETIPLLGAASGGEKSTRVKVHEALLLSAGKVARANSAGVLVEEHPLQDIEQHLSWRSGVLAFHRTPLAEAVEEINRYNARQIVIRDPSVAAIQVGGIFEATKIDAFLHLLESGFPIAISQEGDRIVIASR